eukprot:scaffold127988_cov30-Tisochrysis_lutea.AAC.1
MNHRCPTTKACTAGGGRHTITRLVRVFHFREHVAQVAKEPEARMLYEVGARLERIAKHA